MRHHSLLLFVNSTEIDKIRGAPSIAHRSIDRFDTAAIDFRGSPGAVVVVVVVVYFFLAAVTARE